MKVPAVPMVAGDGKPLTVKLLAVAAWTAMSASLPLSLGVAATVAVIDWTRKDKAQRAESPHAKIHGYRTIADIMRALNPFSGEIYLLSLRMSRLTREMFCLMEGRHTHPSTLYPGGVGTVPTQQLFTDFLVRLM